MENNTRQPQPLKQVMNKTSGQQTCKSNETFVRQVGKQMKTQVAIIVAFVILAAIIGGSIFAYKYLRDRNTTDEDTQVKNDSKVSDTKSCGMDEPLFIKVEVPVDWECTDGIDHNDAGVEYGVLTLESPDGVQLSFSDGELRIDTRAEEKDIKDSYLVIDDIRYTAYLYEGNDTEKLDFMVARIKGMDMGSWIFTEGYRLLTDDEVTEVTKIVKTLTKDTRTESNEKVETQSKKPKTFTYTVGDDVIEFDYDSIYYASLCSYQEDGVFPIAMEVRETEKPPTPEEPAKGVYVSVVWVDKEDHQFYGAEGFDEQAGYVRDYTANQCFVFGAEAFEKKIVANREVVYATGKQDCAMPTGEGVEKLETYISAYGVDVSDQYFVVIHSIVYGRDDGINEDLLEQIAATVEVS